MNPIENDNTISLRDIAAILIRRRLQILATFFLTVAAVVTGTLLMPKQYETQMKVLVKNERADIIVTGHTHFERMDWREGVLQINTGSAIHPHLYSTRLGTVGMIEVDASGIRAEIIRLGESEGLRNPGITHTFDGNQVHRLAHG